MTIEEYVIAYLDNTLSYPVSGDVPSPMPEEFVTVEKTGSGNLDHINTETIAIQSWSMSRANAMQLNELVKEAMAMMNAQPEISRCHLDTDYNFTDLDSKRPRYQAVFEIVHYL